MDNGIVQLENARAEAVRTQIKQIQGSLKDRTFDLADLLAEAKDNDYPRLWGYQSYKDWLDNSELDVKLRQADYLIEIVTKSKALDIAREQLRQIKITKLKAIFSLNPAEHADKIRDLINRAVNMSTAEVEQETRALKGLEGEKGTWRNFYFPEAAAAITVDTALEDAKTVAGTEMSDASALEMICATFEKTDVAAVLEQQRKEIEES